MKQFSGKINENSRIALSLHFPLHRRLAKRIYVPLPDSIARKALITHLLSKQGASGGSIQSKELDRIVTLTEGYSGSDLSAVSFIDEFSNEF